MRAARARAARATAARATEARAADAAWESPSGAVDGVNVDGMDGMDGVMRLTTTPVLSPVGPVTEAVFGGKKKDGATGQAEQGAASPALEPFQRQYASTMLKIRDCNQALACALVRLRGGAAATNYSLTNYKGELQAFEMDKSTDCLLYTSPSPRD